MSDEHLQRWEPLFPWIEAQLGGTIVRRELREIRRKSREQVDRLGRRLTLLNLVAGPMLVLAFVGVIGLTRRRARVTSTADASS